MCGRFNLIDSQEIQRLCETIGVTLLGHHMQPDIAPGANIAIVHSLAGVRQVSNATWWLLLEEEKLKPNYRYASFNSRFDKLSVEGSISYIPFRESRCIIPASAFLEGLGDKKTYHKVEVENSAIAFGGLFKEYLNRETAKTVYSASIITCPPITEKWKGIHPKSIPLMIDTNDEEITKNWLDPFFQDVEKFKPLFERKIPKRLRITQIGKPSKWNPIGKSFIMEA